MQGIAIAAGVAVLLLGQAVPASAQVAPAPGEPVRLPAAASPDDQGTAGPAGEPAATAPAGAEHEENLGQDPTRPLTRIDVRVKYKNDPGHVDEEIMTLRADKPFRLGGGWTLGTRVDIPLAVNNRVTLDNPDGGSEFGLSDSLIQAVLITPPQGKWAFAVGGQIVFPTGTADQFTTGKWQLVPTVAAIRQLPELSRGSFIGMVLRDSFSFAGKQDRANINVVTVQPLFNWALPQRWFLTVGPEIKFDTLDGWSPFVPLDLTVGKKITDNIVMSLQGDAAIVNDRPDYDWQVEFRIGLFF